MTETIDLNFDKFAKYKGTEQLKLLRKLEDVASLFQMIDKSLVIKTEELSGGNLSLNIFKNDKWLIGVDCMKDKIAVRYGTDGHIAYRDYSATEEAVIEKELRDVVKNTLE